jgi:hypothetical protein
MSFAKAVGQVGDDGVERITTQAAFDILEIPTAKPEHKCVPAIGEADERAGMDRCSGSRINARRI